MEMKRGKGVVKDGYRHKNKKKTYLEETIQ